MADPAKLQWFGPTWSAPVNDPDQEIPIPVDEDCARCAESIQDGAQGLAIPVVPILAQRMVEAEADLPVGGLWPSDHIFFHRNCFMAAIGVPRVGILHTAEERCPTCGSPVKVISGEEGTAHYELDIPAALGEVKRRATEA